MYKNTNVFLLIVGLIMYLVSFIFPSKLGLSIMAISSIIMVVSIFRFAHVLKGKPVYSLIKVILIFFSIVMVIVTAGGFIVGLK